MGGLRIVDPARSLPDWLAGRGAGSPRRCRPHVCRDGPPPVHRDPFDRLLVAQAIAEGLLISVF